LHLARGELHNLLPVQVGDMLVVHLLHIQEVHIDILGGVDATE